MTLVCAFHLLIQRLTADVDSDLKAGHYFEYRHGSHRYNGVEESDIVKSSQGFAGVEKSGVEEEVEVVSVGRC
jgi:hypothetical protein